MEEKNSMEDMEEERPAGTMTSRKGEAGKEFCMQTITFPASVWQQNRMDIEKLTREQEKLQKNIENNKIKSNNIYNTWNI